MDLASWISKQRWFGAKSRELKDARAVERIPIPRGFELVVVEARFVDGGASLYQLCARPGSIEDAFAEPEAARAVAEAAGVTTEAEPRPMGVEQSNSSVRFGDDVVVKLYRKIELGPNPDAELSRFLSEKARFRGVPGFRGVIENQGRTLAIAQDFVPSRGDGWADALGSVRAFYDDPTPASQRAWEEPARALGRITAEMHLALASARREPDLEPEPITADDCRLWRAGMSGRLARVAQLTDIEAIRTSIEQTFDAIASVVDKGLKIRIHGDYHLGQVLRKQDGDFAILDFEGEPARPLAERRKKHTAMRDVAGMARSFNYAAYAVLFERTQPGTPDWKRLEPEAYAWESVVRQAFLDAYFAAVGDAPILPRDEAERQRLLAVFELDKAVYELGYELDNRPDWARIPRKGIERVAVLGRAP